LCTGSAGGAADVTGKIAYGLEGAGGAFGKKYSSSIS